MNKKNLFSAFIFALSLCIPTLQASASTIIPTAGKTEVAFSNEFVGALVIAAIKPGAVGPGTLSRKGIATFPITTGAIESTNAEIDHSGGLFFTNGTTRVVLSSFIIDTTVPQQPILTGLVILNSSLVARIPLFNVNLSAITVTPKGKKVTISNAVLTLSKASADAINSNFNPPTPFTENFPVGTATIKVTNSKSE
jgi:hypothetical protein